MLGDAVSRSFHAVWPEEIFHRDHAGPQIDFRASEDVKQRLNFFNFRHELFQQAPSLAFPSGDNQSMIFDAYLDYVVSSEKSERYLFDIKYTSWHHLNRYWSQPFQRPHLLDRAIHLGFRIVHLKRRNLLALYCSHRLAEATNVWRTVEPAPLQRQALTVDTSHCLRTLVDLRATEHLFDRWLSRYPHGELRYESLLSGDTFSKEVEDMFRQIYRARPVAALFTVYRKITPSLRDVVVNRNEVLSALRGTDFQSMAEEALG